MIFLSLCVLWYIECCSMIHCFSRLKKVEDTIWRNFGSIN